MNTVLHKSAGSFWPAVAVVLCLASPSGAQTVPTVSTAVPGSGVTAGGTHVTVYGFSFVAGAEVHFLGSVASPTPLTEAMDVVIVTDQQLTCTAPPHAAGMVDILVVNADGGQARGTNMYEYVPPVLVDSVFPTRVAVDKFYDIDMHGTGFVDLVTNVSWRLEGDTSWQPTNNVFFMSSTSISFFFTTSTAGWYDIRVENGDSHSILYRGLEVIDAPVVEFITPDAGPAYGGSTVTIVGDNYDAASNLTGACALTSGNRYVYGTGTRFLLEVAPTDLICISNESTWYEVGAVLSDTTLILVNLYAGPTATGQPVAKKGTATAYVGVVELANVGADFTGAFVVGETGTGTVVDGQIAGHATDDAGSPYSFTIQVQGYSGTTDTRAFTLDVGTLEITTDPNLPMATVATRPWGWDKVGDVANAALFSPAMAGVVAHGRYGTAVVTLDNVRCYNDRNGADSQMVASPDGSTSLERGVTGSHSNLSDLDGDPNSYIDHYEMTASAGGTFLDTDAFYAVYQTASGIEKMICQVTAQNSTDDFDKSGLMFRMDDITSDTANHVSMFRAPGGKAYFQYRIPGTFDPIVIRLESTGDLPCWLRLTRDPATNYYEGWKFDAKGQWYVQQLEVAGGIQNYTWTLQAGSLPPGLSLTPAGKVDGIVSVAGAYSFTVRATDSSPTPLYVDKAMDIVVRSDTDPLSVTDTDGVTLLGDGDTIVMPDMYYLEGFQFPLEVSGGMPYYEFSSTDLPIGWVLGLNDGVLSCVTPPEVFTNRLVHVTITDSGDMSELANNTSSSITVTCQATVRPNGSSTITTTSLPPAAIGAPYEFPIHCVGGAVPRTWSIVSGALPPGLHLNASLADVRVVSFGNESILFDEYTYVEGMTVANAVPATGDWEGGTSVVITGVEFATNARVFFGHAESTSVTVGSSTQITCTTPRHLPPRTVEIRVVNPDDGNVGVLPLGFTYTGPTEPVIIDVAPREGLVSGGTTITVTGDHFDRVASPSVVEPTVYFGGKCSGRAVFEPGDVAVLGIDTSFGAGPGTPNDIQTGDYVCLAQDGHWVEVASVDGTGQLTLTAPYSASLAGGTGVIYSGTLANPAQVAVQFSPSAVQGQVTFTNGSDTVSGSGTAFTTDVDPGDFVKPTGGQWAKVAAVPSDASLTLTRAYGGTTAAGVSAEVSADDTISVVTPAHSLARMSVFVCNPDDLYCSARKTTAFLNAGCTVTDVTPDVGPASAQTVVTITGAGFDEAQDPVVIFGNLLAGSVTVAAGGGSLTCIAPGGTGDVQVSVRNDDCLATTWSGTYHYMAQTVISAVTDDGGVAGDFITADPTLVVTGTGDVGATVEVKLDGTVHGTTTVDGSGSWSYDMTATTLTEGVHYLQARAYVAGSASAYAVPVTVVLDTTAPDAPVMLSIIDDSNVGGDAVTTDTTLVVIGTAEASSLVELFCDGVSCGTMTASVGGAFSFDYTSTVLSEGVYDFTATSTDSLANTSVVSTALTVTVDTTPPAPPVFPATLIVTSDTTPTVTWSPSSPSISPLYRWQLDGEAPALWTETAAASWTSAAELELDTYTLYVMERDDAGNWSTTSSSCDVTIIHPPGTSDCTPGDGHLSVVMVLAALAASWGLRRKRLVRAA